MKNNNAKMPCFVSQPDNVVFEIAVDPKKIGQTCLEKVCEDLNVRYESDYFGLKYVNGKGEDLWLNLRNPIEKQVNLHGHSFFRLALRVKFWVPPHILQQDSTRHQFYLHAKLDFLEGRLMPPDWECAANLIAHIAQAENEDFNDQNPCFNVYHQISSIRVTAGDDQDDVDSCQTLPADVLLQKIVKYHKLLKGVKKTSAKYWFLKLVSEFDNFGEENFAVKCQSGHGNHNNNNGQENQVFGVGPHGITIYEESKAKERISFTNITSASSHKRTFRLEYLTLDAKDAQLTLKLDSNHLASSLYRAITEKHAFYSCETVRSAVTSQYIRDLKGTIVSIFNEDSTLGKKYVFDIRRTCREVYDNVRRAIYQDNGQAQMTKNCDESKGDDLKNSQEKLSRLFSEAMNCKICMDSRIDVIFVPCGHGIACTLCASKCDKCPLCRSDITKAQKFFFDFISEEA